MRPLTLADFTPRLGKPMPVKAANGGLQLSLVEAQPLPPSPRVGGTFRLEFHGPLQPMLGQGTYRFLVGSEPHDIFIVPIGPIGDKMRYEAVFY